MQKEPFQPFKYSPAPRKKLYHQLIYQIKPAAFNLLNGGAWKLGMKEFGS